TAGASAVLPLGEHTRTNLAGRTESPILPPGMKEASAMGMFDQAARYACRAAPEPVARRLLRKVRQRLELEQFHDTRTTPLPGQRDRTVDSVLSLRDLDRPASPCLVIVEFQSEHDEDKLHTTLVSVAHMRADVRHGPEREGRYEVFAGLVYL